MGQSKKRFNNIFGSEKAFMQARKSQLTRILKPAISREEFYHVTRAVNSLIAERVAEGETIMLPKRVGKLYLVKLQTSPTRFAPTTKYTYNKIDWKSTKDLWEKDPETKKEGIVLYFKNKNRYAVRFDSSTVGVKNKIFFQFLPARSFFKLIKKAIDAGGDALYKINFIKNVGIYKYTSNC